ncbi:Fc.00g054440.m01.CDS01 [Cosmosporella sp. VM-42]
MDTSELEEFFKSAWLSTAKGCQEKIQDREDKRTVRSFRSYDDIVEHLINDPDEPLSDSVLRELSMIRPRLVELRDFSHDFAERLGPSLDPGLFWGLMGVMLTVAAQIEEPDATRRIAQMLKKLSRDVEHLRGHCSAQSSLSNKEKEAVFETMVAATKFFGDATQFLRDEEHFIRCRSSDQDPWRRLREAFDIATRDIEESLKTVEKTAALSSHRSSDMTWLYSMMSLTPRSWKDDATLPCVMLPPSRNAKFFNREDVIDRIEEHFNRASSQAFRSVALYGMGGVGKTHVAMKYAEERFTKRGVSAILWVEAESEIKVKQSFTDIAKRLQLPNYVPHNHDDNRLLVMNWLQQTKSKWLLVYDNVESFDVLHAHWPNSVVHGHALITTRNRDLAYEPAETGIEVSPWDTNMGSKFLLHLLSGHISADILANQGQSALDLSERLSGHALALARMGGIIHRRDWTIQQLVEVYDRQPEFKNGIGPVWQLSFQNLNLHSGSLLSVFAFCSADRIPQGLLEAQKPDSVLKYLPWCTDTEKISQAMEELQTLSLIKKDRETRMLSVHRLIQSHYQEFLGVEGRQDAHARASKLVFLAFPQRAAQLHGQWELCSLYVQHVLALRDNFRREQQRNPNFTACREFCEVSTTCERFPTDVDYWSRFLLEQHEFQELQDLCAVNDDALSSLKGEDRLWDMRSSIPSYLGQMYLRSGFHKKGIECLHKSLEVRTQEEDGDQMEVSWAEHNLGEAYVTTGDLDKAYAWFERAAETWKRWSAMAPKNRRPETSPFQRMSIATCLLYMGRIDEARLVLKPSLETYMESTAEHWMNAAYATFLLGRIEMAEKNLSVAESLFMQAQNLWFSGDKARTSYFNGACMYRMGCCALDQGNVEAAVDALVVTGIHKKYMVGEHARCLYKLSQAFYQDIGKELEAETVLQEAEGLYFTRSEDQGRTPTEGDYDRLVHLRWR